MPYYPSYDVEVAIYNAVDSGSSVPVYSTTREVERASAGGATPYPYIFLGPTQLVRGDWKTYHGVTIHKWVYVYDDSHDRTALYNAADAVTQALNDSLTLATGFNCWRTRLVNSNMITGDDKVNKAILQFELTVVKVV